MDVFYVRSGTARTFHVNRGAFAPGRQPVQSTKERDVHPVSVAPPWMGFGRPAVFGLARSGAGSRG